MTIQKQNLITIISVIISILFSSYLWDFIKLPYKEVNIIGVYSSNEYNSINEILRYIFFIFFPFSVFIGLQFFYKNISLNIFYTQLTINENAYYKDLKLLNLTLILLLFLTFLEFFSVSFDLGKLDLFHDGQRLSSAYKSLSDNSLWSGSYVIVGIFYETLSAKFIWQLFDHESIGLMRFADRIFILLCKILIILIVYKIAIFSKLKFFYKEIFLVICSLILIPNLFDYHNSRIDSEYLSFREFPVLILTYFFLEIISNKNTNKILINFLGPISFFSMIWSIDRGLICNLLIIVILFYFLLTKQFKCSIILLLSVIFTWVLSIIFLQNEFNFFLDNTLGLLRNINYIFGEIHTIPFGSDPASFRSVKILSGVIFCLIIAFSLFRKNNSSNSSQFKIAMLFLAIVSFLTYGYNLGRSGGSHLKEVFGYSIIFTTIIIIAYLLQFISKKNLLKSISKFKINIFLLIFTLSVFFSFHNISFKNIIKFNERFFKYVNLEDSYFLRKVDILFLNKTKNIIKDYKCVQMFSNEAAYLYLLKKANCTKYYFVFAIGSIKDQKNMINDLNNVQIIITTEHDDKGHPKYRLPLVKKYIEENYFILYEESTLSSQRSKRIILKRKLN